MPHDLGGKRCCEGIYNPPLGVPYDFLPRFFGDGAARALNVRPAQILAYADNAKAQLESKGVTVLVGKEAAQDDQNFAYLGAAALGALIAAILAKAK